jgi:hypothetical protein
MDVVNWEGPARGGYVGQPHDQLQGFQFFTKFVHETFVN